MPNTKKRSEKKRIKVKRPPWTYKRQMLERHEPKIEVIRSLTIVPSQCPNCGCRYLEVFTEKISFNSCQMVHCLGVRGGCGRTWRFLGDAGRLLPQGDTDQ